jgi:hypothetical protein
MSDNKKNAPRISDAERDLQRNFFGKMAKLDQKPMAPDISATAATSNPSTGDAVLDVLLQRVEEPTLEMYLGLAYPDREIEDLLSDAEKVSMVPAELFDEDPMACGLWGR